MEFEFDKEMDSLLRQAAQSESPALAGGLGLQSLHLDADEISLFAENALPAKSRSRATEHLADCLRCRKILSNLISLNAESESEIVHAKQSEPVVAAAIPWYKKLFMFPQMAFAVGALALLFSGVIALMFLQTARQSDNASVAQNEDAYERPVGSKGMSSDGETTASESYPMSNSASTANTSSTSNTTSMSNATTATTSNSNSLMTTTNTSTTTTTKNAPVVANTSSVGGALLDQIQAQAGRDKELRPAAKPVPPEGELAKSDEKTAKEEYKVKTGPPAKREDDYRDNDNETARMTKQQAELSQNTMTQSQRNIMPDSQNVPRSAPMAGARSENRKSVATETADAPKDVKNKAPERRRAGDKTFNFASGVWYDTSYNQQATVNVRRGTPEYKKLDSGLRSIAESIGGTLVVVWKGKAYRIQ